MNAWLGKLIDMCVAPRGQTLTSQSITTWFEVSDYDGLTLLRMQGPTTTFFASHAQEWQQAYLERSLFRVDPIVELTRRKKSLVSWDLPSLCRGRTGEARDVCELADAFGIRSGFSVPISIGFGHHAIFTIYSGSTAKPDVSNIDPILLASAVTHLHRSLRMSPSCQMPPVLKPREVQCLRWASEGRSIREVADLEGVSYSTARFFIDRAKEALGAVSLPQATALAKELQLI